MRIAIYSEIYWPMVSGVALTLRRLVDALHARGHAVRVYSPHYELPPGAVERPEVHRSPGRPFFLAPDVQWAFPRVPDLIADMREFEPQVVHLATEFAMGYPGLRASKALGLPIIASSHTDYEAYARPYGRWLVTAVRPGWAYMRWFYRHAHKVLCPTRVHEAHLHARGVHHTGIWTRGVNAEEFNPRFRSDAWRARFGIGPSDCLVTFVGRVAPEKNLEILLDAWQRLAPVRGNAQLVLVGRWAAGREHPRASHPGCAPAGLPARDRARDRLRVVRRVRLSVGNGNLRQCPARGHGIGNDAGLRQCRRAK